MVKKMKRTYFIDDKLWYVRQIELFLCGPNYLGICKDFYETERTHSPHPSRTLIVLPEPQRFRGVQNLSGFYGEPQRFREVLISEMEQMIATFCTMSMQTLFT